jgi:hypothetical protein
VRFSCCIHYCRIDQYYHHQYHDEHKEYLHVCRGSEKASTSTKAGRANGSVRSLPPTLTKPGRLLIIPSLGPSRFSPKVEGETRTFETPFPRKYILITVNMYFISSAHANVHQQLPCVENILMPARQYQKYK